MKRLAFLALLLIACAAPRNAPVAAQSGAPHVREALNPGDGNQSGFSLEGSDSTALTTGGAPPSQPSLLDLEAATATASPETASTLSGAIGTALVGGWATYCDPTPTRCQSWAPPALLGAVPWFRDGDAPFGVQVCVDDGARCVAVQVVSFCACGDRDGIPTVIDISPAAFEQLAPLSLGVIRVSVEDLRGTTVPLPRTDLAEQPMDLRLAVGLVLAGLVGWLLTLVGAGRA